MNKILIIIRKEWSEVFLNRMVLMTVIFMPLLFSALPLIILFSTRNTGSADYTSDMPAQFAQICPEGLSGGECFQVYMVNQFMILFMMLPLIIPVNIAAYSIVGEKTQRSLEPLLASPITTAELLIGKNLAAVIPAVLATWVGFLIYAIGVRILTSNPLVVGALLDSMWLLAIFIAGPLMAVLSVNFSLMVSSRVNDPRVAEQLSTVVIVPLLALFFGQIAGLIFVNKTIILIMIAVLLILDAGAVYLCIQFFQRETILTRWK
ncbi:MAG: ABC transporter permease subunit [Anaerolineales bacterium]|nr:ABC transporter permease subunit [Anaerolineales bacterium]